MKKDITALFCFVDDFCKVADQWISPQYMTKRLRRGKDSR